MEGIVSDSQQSPFARALEGALRSVNVPFATIAAWIPAPTTEEQIEDWIADRSVPEASRLAAMIAFVRGCVPPADPAEADRFHAARAEFARVLETSGQDVSPHGRHFVGTPGRYSLGPLFDQFEGVLACLPTRAQEEILLHALQTVAEMRGADPAAFDMLAQTRPTIHMH